MGALQTWTTLLILAISGATCQHTQLSPAVSPAGQPTPYAMSDLPRQPEVACAATAVEDALLDCEGLQDAQRLEQCCLGLDAVYANRSSAAFGCLCLPMVLYETARRASEYEIDVLGSLQLCRRRHPHFSTQWAAGRPSACPRMALRGDVMGWLTGMGSSPFLGVDVPTWAWSNLLQAQWFVVQHPAGSQVQTDVVDYILGRLLPQCVMLAMLSITLLFFVMHNHVLLRTSNVYKALPLEQQLVTCQHAVHVVAYSLTILPQTWLACELLFKAWTGEDLVKRTSSILIALAMGRAVLFTVEACVRSVKWSWLLFLHHALVMLVTSINLWDGSPVLVALSTVLDLFAAHELPLYGVLLAYRLRFWSHSTTRACLRASCAWYVVTRLLQTATLAYMLSHHLAVPSIRSSPAFITIAVLSAAFTAFQAFTLVIYHGMDHKLCQDEAKSSSSSKAGVSYDEALGRDASPQHQHESQFGDGVRRRKARQSPMRASDGAQLKDQCGVR